ncbi:MAG TPA: hypothetical protein VG186_16990, partial [Solirubrobacteraceae bacterium]|nr:hypothetical protein [Solirubrobacteraceae bacterium]
MIGLVYLAWAPLGPEEPRRFLASYREHDAGAEHELVVLLNGVAAASGDPAAARAEVLGALHEVPHRVIEVDPPRIDLAAYGEAARRLEHSHLCFLNSYAEVLVDGWLGHLERALAQPGVAMAGATGSW